MSERDGQSAADPAAGARDDDALAGDVEQVGDGSGHDAEHVVPRGTWSARAPGSTRMGDGAVPRMGVLRRRVRLGESVDVRLALPNARLRVEDPS
ncbi:hypothetical protein GCM10027265_05670 [Jatrophihabitans fulvus]